MDDDATSHSPGNVSIKNGVQLPEWFSFPWEESAGWKKLFDTNGDALERTALESGWHFIFIMPPVARGACAFSREAAIDRAVQKIIWTINESDYTSIEITQIAVRRLTFCTERVLSSTLGI